MTIALEKSEWIDLGPLPNADPSGFGRVHLVRSPNGPDAVAKFIPRSGTGPTDRELLVAALAESQGARNVVPILDRGEHDGEWVLVMPLAQTSLARHLREQGPLEVAECIRILQDIATALADLTTVAVHRDVKPSNILKIGETWCLTDFGIARYVDEATGTDTWKGNGSRPYAAPETFQMKHATPATDVYSFGVVAFEMLEGRLPFPGPDFASDHLYATPPAMRTASPQLRAVVTGCLNKEPATRPTPNQVIERLARAAQRPARGGFAALAEVDAAVTVQQAADQAQAARVADEERTQSVRFDLATRALTELSEQFIEQLTIAAPSVRISRSEGHGAMLFVARLEHGSIGLAKPTRTTRWSGPFDVVAHSSISVTSDFRNFSGYRGRSHSLWYCDAHYVDEYAWFETAFMQSPLLGGGLGEFTPEALEPAAAGAAFSHAMGTIQLAWPFDEVDHVAPDEFIERWSERFAQAAAGTLQRPTSMPEKRADDSYRPLRSDAR